ncbi:MAG: hypothetical protein ACK5IQ_10645 [Bacteroidales bacterium]
MKLNILIIAFCSSISLFSCNTKAEKQDECYLGSQPDWFDAQRVQGHSRVMAYFNKPDDSLYASWAKIAMSGVGIHAFTRHIKSNEGSNQWKSSWGTWTELANSRNIIAEAITEAHSNNCHIIGYYNHYTDAYLAKNYPEYKCKDVNGNDVVKANRGTMLCFNSPMIDSIGIRLVEFVKMGGDGIYFDEIHMPRKGCWCNNCKTIFKQQTGKDAPSAINENDQRYKEYQDFNNQTVISGFKKWIKQVKAVNEDLVMIVGSNTLPKLIHRHLNTDLFRIADAHKTEWDIPMRTLRSIPKGIAKPDPKVWRGLSYTLSRDISDGRPAHFWIPSMSYVPSEHIKAATTGIISFGNIANLDMKENCAPDKDFIPAVEYGNKASKALASSRVNSWLLIHFNEKALKKYLGTSADGWKNFLSAFYGAYYCANKQHIPVGIITDSQLRDAQFRGAKVIFLPQVEILDKSSKRSLETFKKDGGLVISNQQSWQWHLGGTDFNDACNLFNEKLKQANQQEIMKSEGGSSFYYSTYFTKEDSTSTTYLASYSNQLEWVVSGVKSKKQGQIEAAESVVPDSVGGINLSVANGKQPLSVVEAISGKDVPFRISDGELKVLVPTFLYGSIIEIKYKK